MMGKLEPLDDYVVVQRSEAETVTPGGVVLPEVAKEKPQRGKVLAVGLGRVLESGKLYSTGVQAGQTVIFGPYTGTEIKVDGEEYLLVRASELMARLV